MDEDCIYAINEKEEICKIYCDDLKIVMKRKIEGLSNPKEIISSHIQQLTPCVFAIGSVVQIEPENPEVEANLKPYLHLVCGDLSNPKEELGIRKYEMSFSETFDPKKPVIFRTLYIPEKYQEIS